VLNTGQEPFPGYRLGEKLGSGGFGEVWAATGPDGKAVALKFIDCQGKPGSAIAQEIRMMRSLKDLKHPNFIRLHGVCASSPYIIIIMERADGSLKDLQNAYLEETGRNIPAEHVLELLEQAALGLDSLAEVKLSGFNWTDGCVQHCDVKPSNLLIVGDTLKVADFGLCSSAKLEFHEGFRGTPPYAAPELYEGRTTSRTDQYGLAVTFCELCMGDRAFVKDCNDYTSYKGLPIDVTKLRDEEFAVLSRAMSERWTDRYPSCREFVAALKRATRVTQSARRVPAASVPH
jgi:serine/threonine protein kinase